VDRPGHSAVKCCRASMANALAKRIVKRNKIVNLILLFLVMVPVSVFVFWVSDELRLGTNSAFAVLVGVPFLVYVGRQYPSKLRDPAFVAFLVAWVVVHVTVFLLVLKSLGFAYYIPFAALELWVGYKLAIHRFGPPSRSK
jgi:hypothetical protein